MTNSIFADGVSNVFVTNGIVRMDLVASTVESGGKLKATPVGTLAIPLVGFVNLHSQIDRVMKKMIEDGLLKVTPPVDEKQSNESIDLNQIKL